MPGHEVAIVPQLCVALNCLPSQIYAEDYNDIVNIRSVLNAHRKLEKAATDKLNRNRK